MNEKIVKVLVAIADGVEEVETVSVIDVLKRAGAEITVAAAKDLQITASHGTKLVADKTIADCLEEDFALVFVPGGMPGAENLRDCMELAYLLLRQKKAGEGHWFSAICASPVVVLQHHGLLDGVKATCYPSLAKELKYKDEESIKQKVVVDGNCVTSQGPGTALLFAIKLVELLFDKDKAKKIAKGMLVR